MPSRKRGSRGGLFSVALAVHGSSQTRVPDVIRHTTLWSSDFPPPMELRLAPEPTGSDRPVLLPVLSVSQMRFHQLR